jgi:hypothetical protein
MVVAGWCSLVQIATEAPMMREKTNVMWYKKSVAYR